MYFCFVFFTPLHMRRNFLVIFLLASIVLTANAQTTFTIDEPNGNAFTYTVINTNEVTLTAWEPDPQWCCNVNLPSTVQYNGNNYKVTAIGPNAFVSIREKGSLYVITFKIPNSVVHIADHAIEGFYHCTVFIAKDHPVYEVRDDDLGDTIIEKNTGRIIGINNVAEVDDFPKDYSPEDNSLIFVDKVPQFPGGLSELKKYLVENVQYPLQEEHWNGTVLVEFIVETDGSITNVKVIHSVHPRLDAEAVRLIKGMPKWIPAENNGEPVRAYYNIPIQFNL